MAFTRAWSVLFYQRRIPANMHSHRVVYDESLLHLPSISSGLFPLITPIAELCCVFSLSVISLSPSMGFLERLHTTSSHSYSEITHLCTLNYSRLLCLMDTAPQFNGTWFLFYLKLKGARAIRKIRYVWKAVTGQNIISLVLIVSEIIYNDVNFFFTFYFLFNKIYCKSNSKNVAERFSIFFLFPSLSLAPLILIDTSSERSKTKFFKRYVISEEILTPQLNFKL